MDHVSQGISQMNAECPLETLSEFEAITRKYWAWPGLLDFKGLDEALANLMDCLFAKAKEV